MADEVLLGVAVVPVRVKLDELDAGLNQARAQIEGTLGQAFDKAGAGAKGLQSSISGVSGSVSGLSGSVAGLSGETGQASAAATQMGNEIERAASGKGAPAVRGLVEQVGGLTQGLAKVIQIAGSAVALEGVRRLGEQWLQMGASGAELINIENSYKRLAESVGVNSDQMLADMVQLSAGTMTQAELMKAYNIGVGLAGEAVATRFGEYIQMARAAAAQTGQSFDYMLNSALVATGRLSNVIADNLTITVDTAAAYEKYAASIGKTADELTKVEQQEAFAIEMLEQAERKFGDLDEATQALAGQGIAQLKTALEELGNAAAMTAAPGIDRVAGSVATLAGLLQGPTLKVLELYSAQQRLVTSGEGAVGTYRSLANAVSLYGAATPLVLAAQVGLEQASGALTQRLLDQIRAMSQAGDPIAQYVAGLLDLKGAFSDTSGMSATAAIHLMRAAEAEAALAAGARDGRVDLEALNGTIGSTISMVAGLSEMASGASGVLAGMASNLTVSMMKAQDYARGNTRPQLEWFTTGRPIYEMGAAYKEYIRALSDWAGDVGRDAERQGQSIWRDHVAGIGAATSGYGGLKSAMEDYYSSWASQAQGILTPTQDFDLNALTEEVYGYQDKWDEAARRAMDVVKLGTDSPWAAEMGLGGKEDALQYIRDFYAGKLPDDVNWDSAIGQYQMQMEQQLGSQNLAAMFQEKLLGSGWGPGGEALSALEAPFGPGGENAATAFAESFTGHDWDSMTMTASERILTGLSTHLNSGQSRYSDQFERFVISVVKRVFFNGAEP